MDPSSSLQALQASLLPCVPPLGSSHCRDGDHARCFRSRKSPRRPGKPVVEQSRGKALKSTRLFLQALALGNASNRVITYNILDDFTPNAKACGMSADEFEQNVKVGTPCEALSTSVHLHADVLKHCVTSLLTPPGRCFKRPNSQLNSRARSQDVGCNIEFRIEDVLSSPERMEEMLGADLIHIDINHHGDIEDAVLQVSPAS